jgi:hypothetical protein
MQIVMALNQLDTITNVEDKDLKAFAENTMTALLKRRQSKGFRAFVDLFGQIHDKDGKI